MQDLKEWCEENCYFWSDSRPYGRPEIHGIPVYAVNAESHFRVA